MGRVTATAELHANLSNHNDEQDEIDRATWERLLAAVRELIRSDPAYAEIDCRLDG